MQSTKNIKTVAVPAGTVTRLKSLVRKHITITNASTELGISSRQLSYAINKRRTSGSALALINAKLYNKTNAN